MEIPVGTKDPQTQQVLRGAMRQSRRLSDIGQITDPWLAIHLLF